MTMGTAAPGQIFCDSAREDDVRSQHLPGAAPFGAKQKMLTVVMEGTIPPRQWAKLEN